MEQQKQLSKEAKIITIIERTDDEQGYNVKMEIEGLAYYPYEVILNSLMVVTDFFINHQKNKNKNEQNNLQLEQTEANTESTGNGSINNNSQPDLISQANNGQV